MTDERTGTVPADIEAARPQHSGHRHSDRKPAESMQRATLGAVLATLALWATFTTSCHKDDGAEPNAPVATVPVTPATSTIAPGGAVQLQATLKDASGATLTDRVITWSSSSDAVATVSPTALVTGVAPGSAAITAASEGRSGIATMTVTKPEPPPPSARIGVRVVGGSGEFYDRNSGQMFVARGTNYVRLAWQQAGPDQVFYHSTFNVGTYDASRADAALARMQAQGFNVVRVFLNGCCESVSIGRVPTGLSAAYLDNFADFLRKAAAHHVFVMPTTDGVPGFGQFGDSLNAYCCSPFDYYSVHYLTPGGVNSSALFWRLFVQGLLDRSAPLDAIFAYELRNELYFDSNFSPFSLSSGIVTAANGQTYDLADATAKQRLMDEGLVYWVDQSRAAIRLVVPDALVTVGFFVPQGPNPTRVGDPRVIQPYPAIAASTADFVDVHAYPFAGDLTLAQLVENFGFTGFPQKPVMMGEFGAFRPQSATAQDAAQLLQQWQAESCGFAVKGWLLWTWDSEEQTEFWTAASADSAVGRILAPTTRPDPCQ